MSFHPREPWAYVVTELSNQIHCFDLSPEGNLVEKGMFNLLPESMMASPLRRTSSLILQENICMQPIEGTRASVFSESLRKTET